MERVRQRAVSDVKFHCYHLNPDENFLNDLLEGLMRNEERYCYPSYPCRFSSGKIDLDRDIIRPCDYRDLGIEEYGSCYC
ncbi:MAG: ferredoxin-thioredoxin reductase catalytic domain-containing protein [Thermoproteota archaeon]